jgi:hypothetical protein
MSLKQRKDEEGRREGENLRKQVQGLALGTYGGIAGCADCGA